MLKSKIKSLLILLIVMLLIMTGTSMAADYTCKVSLFANTSTSEVKKGESVTLLVKVTEIQAEGGIASLNAELEYDADVFDCEVTGADEWGNANFFENVLFVSRKDYTTSSKDQTVAKIVLTAKADASVGKQTIKLKGMEFSTGTETFSVNDVSCTITVVEDKGNNDDNKPDDNKPDDTNTNKPSGDNNPGGDGNSSQKPSGSGSTNGGSTSGTGTGNGTSTSTPKKSTSGGSTSTIANVSSSNNSIPKTGITDVLIVGAIIGIIVAVIFYIKYKRAY